VNREHKTSDNEDTPANDLAELSCENNSTTSLDSDHSQLDGSKDPEDPDSLKEDDSDAQSYNSSLDSVEDDTSCNLGDESQEYMGQIVRVFRLLKCVRLSKGRIMIMMMPRVSILGQTQIKVHIYTKTQ
jgi:hypothetical protein